MARPAEALHEDPAVVLIPDDHTGSMDDWLKSLIRDKPIDLPVCSADLVAEARAEQE